MIEQKDFSDSGADIAYSMSYDCDSQGCDEEGICRCGVVENSALRSADIPKMAECIYGMYFQKGIISQRNGIINQLLYGIGKDIDIYCIDRILRARQIWKPERWDIIIAGGYYGQEIEEVRIKKSTADEIEADLEAVFGMGSLADKIGFLLNLEYGYVLPELEGCRYEMKSVRREDISLGSLSQERISKSEDLWFYSEKRYSGIRGVAVESGGKLRLIDGYHRIAAAGASNIKLLVAVR